MRLSPLVVVLVLLAVVSTAIYIGLFVRLPIERPLAYFPVDDSTLAVVAIDSPNVSCSISQVVESSDAVRIHAQCLKPLIIWGSTGMAEQFVFQVTLDEPLAGRPVFDGSGSLAMLCQKPVPNCYPFG